jgi:hypothetical protein
MNSGGLTVYLAGMDEQSSARERPHGLADTVQALAVTPQSDPRKTSAPCRCGILILDEPPKAPASNLRLLSPA